MYYCYWDIYDKQADLALMLVKETAKSCFYITEEIFIVLNLNMEIILVNDKACEFIGYEGKEIIGKKIAEIFISKNTEHNIKSLIDKITSNETNDTDVGKFHNIVLTRNGEKRAVEWNTALLKDDAGKITGILIAGKDVTTERIEIQNVLMQAKKEWEETFDTISDAITIHDTNHNIIRANKTAIELFKTSFAEIIKMKCFQLFHGSDSPISECPCCNEKIKGKTSVHKMFEPHLNKHLEIKIIPRIDKNGHSFGVVHIVRDISDQIEAEEKQRELEKQLLQMQKMESIGRLAGGVAHDFNNILNGILGFSELALMDIPEDNPTRERIELIFKLGEKAASLTNQLLAFSRKQLLVMKDINLNNLVTGMEETLKRIIGEEIILELKPATILKNIMADQSQMEKVLINLAVNARDAMPNGGILTIELSDIFANENNIQNIKGMSSGEFVKLVVRDTGCGMSKDVLKNIFEPFYTTKNFGKGTGLGLSTVYGIIKQHNGFIDVSSEIDQGTILNIYLPASERDVAKVTDKDAAQIAGGKETILVVDDEPTLISIIEKALLPMGYKLLIAFNPEEAIKISETYDGIIDLLLTDITMPTMNGQYLAERIISRRPGIKVVFMSGYPAESTVNQSDDIKYDAYLQKPIRINMFREKLREVLDKKN